MEAKFSPSEKAPTSELPRGIPSSRQMSRASAGLEFPVKILMSFPCAIIITTSFHCGGPARLYLRPRPDFSLSRDVRPPSRSAFLFAVGLGPAGLDLLPAPADGHGVGGDVLGH